MDICLEETDDFIKESIDHSLGLPLSEQTLELRLRASEESERRRRDQYFFLHSKIREKDEIIERAKAEASMNAQALRKFVDENQKLAFECSHLLAQCKRWERECSLYDHDREALMEFGNEADERARQAEIRVNELEEEVMRLSEDLKFYKNQCGTQSDHETSTGSTCNEEDSLLESLLAILVSKDQSTAYAFLEANSGVDACQGLLKIWDRLRPSTKKVLTLAVEVKNLHKDKEHLRDNLRRAEEEVNLLFEQSKILNDENKRLVKQYKKERNPGSAGNHSSSASSKGNKRKSSAHMMSSPVENKLEFGDVDSQRQPLSTLENVHESKMHVT